MVVSRTLVTRLVAIGVVLLVVVGASAGYVGYQYSQNPPEVESVDSEWGEVTRDETQVDTRVVVDNPNGVGVPGVVGVRYTTTMNGVVVMEGENPSVSLSAGRNEIAVPATMNNSAIARWWVAHVNDDEESTMTVRGEILGPGGFSQPITEQQSSLSTSMLEALQTSEPRTVTLQGEPFVVLRDQTASWGEADMEETPLDFEATLENRHDDALTLDGIGYVVRMNDVTVGEGQRTEGVTVEPGQTGTIDVRATIDSRSMADWWATHVRNDESTRMTVAMYGLVERDGELQRVPFELFAQDLAFTTDLLESGATSIEPVEDASGDPPAFEQPTVLDSSREWGEVTAETAELRTSVTMQNPNTGDINEFVRFASHAEITVNDVVVTKETVRTGALESGRTSVAASFAWNNSATPRWWVEHVNSGEQSTRSIDQRTLADLGFTRLAVRETSGTATFETDVLAGLESDETVDVTTDGGRTVGRLERTRAAWGQADAQRSPIEVDVTIANTAPSEITLTDLKYTVTMNDVVVGKGTAPESYTVAPGATRTVTYTIVIDTQQMDEWWVSHLRNGEETTVDFETSVLVETSGGSDRATVDSLTQTTNVTTDFLQTDDE